MSKKIILTTMALLIIVVTIIISNNNNIVKNDIKFTVKLVNEEVLVEKELFIKDETLFEVLNNEFDIIINNGFITKIGILEANDDSYIAIYVNGSYATKGIMSLTVNNNDVLSFEYTLL